MNVAVAAVVSAYSREADATVAEFAAGLRARGIDVRGLVQVYEDCENGCQITLVDLASGKRYPITQDLGSGSDACRLDTSLLADATAVMREALQDDCALVIFNRFGSLEAAGQGFSAEMLALMTNGIPVLAIVSDRYLAPWREFTGGLAVELPPDIEALQGWFDSLKR